MFQLQNTARFSLRHVETLSSTPAFASIIHGESGALFTIHEDIQVPEENICLLTSRLLILVLRE